MQINPFPHQFDPDRLELDHGRGVFLFDSKGKKYIDFASGIAVNALGYGNSKLGNAVNRQMKRLVHTSNVYSTSPSRKLALKLIELFGSENSVVHLGNSGTEANEAALKYARAHSYREGKKAHRVLSFKGGFHGRTMGSLSTTGKRMYHEIFGPLLPDFHCIDFNDCQALRKTLDSSYVAVILECIQGEGGLFRISEQMVNCLNELTEKYDVLIIADEIQTGLLRTGSLLASRQHGLRTDIITLSKSLAGGLPLSATIIPERVNKNVHLGDHGSTFGGGPVSCAASLAVLETLCNPTFQHHVTKMADLLDELLCYLSQKHENIAELRGLGMLRGLALRDRSQLFDIIGKAERAGLLVLRSGDNVLRICPPLVIKEKEVKKGVEILDDVFSQV